MTRTILTAAILSVSAFGATVTQKADLKFPFRTPAGEHAAGSYTLQIRDNPGTGGIVELRSKETGKAVMFYPASQLVSNRREIPRMVFKCTASECRLAEIWTSSQGFAVRNRTPSPAEAERPVTITLSTSSDE
jgi:hypothetical protein